MDTTTATVEKTEKYSDSRKEAIKAIRSKTIEGASAGGYSQRINLLAYALLRGYAYEQIERKTNADQHCPIGQKTAYSWLISSVANCVSKISSENDPATWQREICRWINERVKIFENKVN